MMASFGDLLTDRRLTLARVEQQLAASAHEPTLAYDQYVCLASGGSSGLRGVFVQTVEEYAEFAASILRRAMARVFATGGPPPDGLPVGIVAAGSPVHSSGFAAAIATGYPARMISIPATLPLEQVVQRLNDAQPPVLLAHASALARLAGERRADRLGISPQAITAMSELLSETDRISIGAAFEVPPINQFVSTEGLVGHSAPGGAVLSFATDMCIVELVDERNRPVADGVASAKVLLTNLHNHTEPLIRTVMVRTPAAVEYQVRQTDRGLDMAVVSNGELDPAELALQLEQSLRTAGLPHPHARIQEVAAIARHPETGKARRFIPL